MGNNRPTDLPERIVADILDTRDHEEVAAAVTRRITHLRAGDIAIVAAQALGYMALIVEEIRLGSPSGAQIIKEIRDGLTADIVAGKFRQTE